MAFESNSDFNTESEYSSGLSIIYQLDNIERALLDATLKRDYSMHYRLLVCYYKTLYSQITPKEVEAHNSRWIELKKAVNDIQTAMKTGNKSIPTSTLDLFDTWEMELRESKQKNGLGMKKYDIRYAMAGRR